MISPAGKHTYLWFVLERNPRGQVAPQVHVTNCVATKQTDKGVAPQSPFEESATTSARWHNLGPGNAPLPLQNSVQEPLFCMIFS